MCIECFHSRGQHASAHIYWNKRKQLHKKRDQLPQDWFGTPTWPPFHCFGTPIWPPWRHVKTLYKRFRFITSVSRLSLRYWSRLFENVKKTIGLIAKTTTLHVHHDRLYISYPFLHYYDVKMPDFAFYEVRKQATTTCYFSFWTWIWSLGIQLQEGSPTFDKVSG